MSDPSCGFCLGSDCAGFPGYVDPNCPEHGDPKQRSLYKLIEACRKLRAARDERWTRAHEAMHQAAAARRTGVGRDLKLPPTVFDIGNVTEEIIEALAEWEREQKKCT